MDRPETPAPTRRAVLETHAEQRKCDARCERIMNETAGRKLELPTGLNQPALREKGGRSVMDRTRAQPLTRSLPAQFGRRLATMRLVPAAAFVATVVAANVMTANLPLVFGMTAGTFIAGLALLARDWLNEVASWRWVLGCVFVGAALSTAMAGPRLALASGLAFGLSELADWGVFKRMRRRGWEKATHTSNAVGAVVDSVLFLAVAGFPVWPGAAVQTLVKVTVTAITVWVVAHAVLRDRLNRAGA